ncbi:methyltransferase domain-containing protein [Paenibacillus tritici]|uniref:Methyltransferase domain-containing protein n=1 Tax=Paenibacillus tritici TaxID=1873425 RepID=A0ABX2DII2_9BACL|nr:class I SAM-dependent methyltransferase [Paenibacillus tritici]NQX44290.1 methyltransferase domain-containing protein [Paenibacillus tritici]QUL57899.1 methyltransferase domain-containing protein [Paenibacillus tritici]
MDRLAKIRSEEKKYHDHCYDTCNLFEPGSWLYKPVATVINLVDQYKEQEYLSVLDLGAGIGRNSIPIAKSLKHRNGQVVCVDLLESAIDKLKSYSQEFGVEPYIIPRLSDIEQFIIEQQEYDLIIAVSALEHVRSQQVLSSKLSEMNAGTRQHGANCIIIASNIREVNLEREQELEPMFEVNLTTEGMLELLDEKYAGWEVQQRFVKHLAYEISRNGERVKLTSDCITYVAKKSQSY